MYNSFIWNENRVLINIYGPLTREMALALRNSRLAVQPDLIRPGGKPFRGDWPPGNHNRAFGRVQREGWDCLVLQVPLKCVAQGQR